MTPGHTLPRDCTRPENGQCVPMSRFLWEKAFRSADLPLELKGMGLLMATYADEMGRDIFPGNVRLARQCHRSEKQVGRYLDALREAGWLARVKVGNRRRHEADTYRLSRPFGGAEGCG